jgi:hypothetical protein
VERRLGTGIPGPGARVRQLLRLSQIPLTSLQPLQCQFFLNRDARALRSTVTAAIIILLLSAVSTQTSEVLIRCRRVER